MEESIHNWWLSVDASIMKIARERLRKWGDSYLKRPVSDRQAFHNKIYEAPQDDACWLVYADWLQENGEEGEYGLITLSVKYREYIRVYNKPAPINIVSTLRKLYQQFPKNPDPFTGSKIKPLFPTDTAQEPNGFEICGIGMTTEMLQNHIGRALLNVNSNPFMDFGAQELFLRNIHSISNDDGSVLTTYNFTTPPAIQNSILVGEATVNIDEIRNRIDEYQYGLRRYINGPIRPFNECDFNLLYPEPKMIPVPPPLIAVPEGEDDPDREVMSNEELENMWPFDDGEE
jgi:uncharacterized protein (TIGR02996 family)